MLIPALFQWTWSDPMTYINISTIYETIIMIIRIYLQQLINFIQFWLVLRPAYQARYVYCIHATGSTFVSNFYYFLSYHSCANWFLFFVILFVSNFYYFLSYHSCADWFLFFVILFVPVIMISVYRLSSSRVAWTYDLQLRLGKTFRWHFLFLILYRVYRSTDRIT